MRVCERRLDHNTLFSYLGLLPLGPVRYLAQCEMLKQRAASLVNGEWLGNR